MGMVLVGQLLSAVCDEFLWINRRPCTSAVETKNILMQHIECYSIWSAQRV